MEKSGSVCRDGGQRCPDVLYCGKRIPAVCAPMLWRIWRDGCASHPWTLFGWVIQDATLRRERDMPTRIILAEDDAVIRMDLKEELEKQGYLVVGQVGDGQSAVNLARELRPDLVVMDIRMPELDGIAAAEILTREKLAPVVLLTAYSEDDLIARARQGRADGKIQVERAGSLPAYPEAEYE